MPQISGTVVYGDGSPASGYRVSGVAGGVLGGMVGPVTTDGRGRFTLSWSSSAQTLAKVIINGSTHATNVSNGDDRTYRL